MDEQHVVHLRQTPSLYRCPGCIPLSHTATPSERRRSETATVWLLCDGGASCSGSSVQCCRLGPYSLSNLSHLLYDIVRKSVSRSLRRMALVCRSHHARGVVGHEHLAVASGTTNTARLSPFSFCYNSVVPGLSVPWLRPSKLRKELLLPWIDTLAHIPHLRSTLCHSRTHLRAVSSRMPPWVCSAVRLRACCRYVCYQ